MPKTAPAETPVELSHVAGPVELVLRAGAPTRVQRCLRCDRVVVRVVRKGDSVELGAALGRPGACLGAPA